MRGANSKSSSNSKGRSERKTGLEKEGLNSKPLKGFVLLLGATGEFSAEELEALT